MSGPGPDLPTDEEKRAGQWLQSVDMRLVVKNVGDDDHQIGVHYIGSAQDVANFLGTMAGVVALKFDVDPPWDQP